MMNQKQIIYDCKTGEVKIEEVEIEDILEEVSMPQELSLEDRVKELEEVNAIQDTLIDVSLLATDEIFMMIEPLLVQNYSIGGNSKMIDMYVAMVQRGLKTIDEVPLRYREEVRLILEKLEK